MTIEATITVEIEHHSGPEIADPNHVRRWLCADGLWLEGGHNEFCYDVCPDHADPDECGCDAPPATYRAAITTAAW